MAASYRTLTWVVGPTNSRLHRTLFFSTLIQTLYLFYIPVSGQLQLGICVPRRVPNRFFGIWDFPYLKLGIKDFKAKSRRDSGLKVCEGGLLPKITLRIARSFGLGLRDPYWGPSKNWQPAFSGSPLQRSLFISRFWKLHLNSHLSWPLSNTSAL